MLKLTGTFEKMSFYSIVNKLNEDIDPGSDNYYKVNIRVSEDLFIALCSDEAGQRRLDSMTGIDNIPNSMTFFGKRFKITLVPSVKETNSNYTLTASLNDQINEFYKQFE